MAKWHIEAPRIPASGVVLSLLALATPVLASTLFREAAEQYEALIWLTALIPAFLLAYYRGWRGVATGCVAAMLVLTATQLYLLLRGAALPEWPVMLGITAAFIGISLLLGGVVERVHTAREDAEALALYDPLTQLPNRRYLELILSKDFAAAKRGVNLVVAMFDVDNFKAFNDGHGHLMGDRALREFTGVLARNTRHSNLSARIGGEEFISLLSSSNVDGALTFVERVRTGLRELETLPAPVTVSVGVAGFTADMTDSSQLLAAADAALYRAKQGGRDRVAVANGNGPIDVVVTSSAGAAAGTSTS
jgi:diguanylate cyclase (GGDEF)-like protein